VVFPLQTFQNWEGDQVIYKSLQTVTLGWPVHSPGQGTMQSVLWTHTLSLIVHMAWRDQRQNFNSLSRMPYIFKNKISVFQIMLLAKREKGSLPEFCYGFNKAFGFF
jgi:hypothetical protein